MTPLQEAVACGHESIAEALLSTPGGAATVDNADHKGYTALHYAAAAGMTSLVDKLLKAGASPDVQWSDGRTPAHMAAKEGYVSTLQTLIAAGASLGATDAWPFIAAACKAVHPEVASRSTLALFLSNNRDASGHPLFVAIYRGVHPLDVGASEAAPASKSNSITLIWF